MRVRLWVGVKEAGEEGGGVRVDSDLDWEERGARSKSKRVVRESVGCGYKAVGAGEGGGLGSEGVNDLKTARVRFWKWKFEGKADLTC